MVAKAGAKKGAAKKEVVKPWTTSESNALAAGLAKYGYGARGTRLASRRRRRWRWRQRRRRYRRSEVAAGRCAASSRLQRCLLLTSA